MKKLIIWVVLSLFSVLANAEIQVQIDPSQINLSEAFKLSLIQEDPQGGGVPDLTILQKDFVILGTERNVNYSIINGQAQSSSQWIVTLRAKKAGILTIPAIKVGLDQSTPTTINVNGGTAQTEPDLQVDPSQAQDVILSTEVSEKKPFVNQQVTYTVRLYTSTGKRLLDTSYIDPHVENALLVPLGEEKRYQTVKNNISYVVEEQSYAVFPQKSGPFNIVSPKFSALVYDLDPQRISIQDKTTSLTVQPIPNQYKGKIWLPAKQVKLTEDYENSSQTISQGSTLTRTITIEGVGIPGQLLPTLKFVDTDAFNVYPEKGTDRNELKQRQLIGRTEVKVTYLFNKAGKVIIPELRLPWFNTETGKEEVATLAPRSLNITASTSGVGNNGQQTINKSSAVKNASSETTSPASPQNKWAWILALLFALAWIITLGLWGWQKRSKTSGKGPYKKALTELDKACLAGNPKSARDALLKWAALHWPDAPLLNLTDLTKLVRDAHLKKQLNLLSQALYRTGDKTMWRGDELLRAVHSIRKARAGTKRKKQSLPPINPF